MLENYIPQITVKDLIHKIKEQVARHQGCTQQTLFNSSSGMKNVNVSHLESLLKDAEIYSQVPAKLPDKLNRFPFNIVKQLPAFLLKLYGFLFKKQRVVNFSIIQALRESLVLNQQLLNQVNDLQTQLNTMDVRLTTTESQMQGVSEHISATESWLHEIGEHLTTNESRWQEINNRFTTNESRLQEINNRFTTNESRLQEINNRFVALDEGYIRNDNYLKSDLAQQKRLITLFLEEAQKRLPEPFTQEELQTFYRQDKHSLDALYVAFEDQFRGSRELITQRLKVYLPLIAEVKVGTQESPILDIGCGRGEWLELLHDSGYVARGLDINRVALDLCRVKQLEVVEADVMSYLRELPDASLGAITGFHIIEHLPFEALVNLFEETVRVLCPGGLAIFETPNPQNVLVGSCNFYLDPTHCNPLPSLLVKFIAESQGLGRIHILNINPSTQAKVNDDSELAKRFNEYFYGSMDYAVVGYRL